MIAIDPHNYLIKLQREKMKIHIKIVDALFNAENRKYSFYLLRITPYIVEWNLIMKLY